MKRNKTRPLSRMKRHTVLNVTVQGNIIRDEFNDAEIYARKIIIPEIRRLQAEGKIE